MHGRGWARMAGRPRTRAGGPKRSTGKPLRGKAAASRNPRGPAPGSWVDGEWVEGHRPPPAGSGIRADGTWVPQFDGQGEPFPEGEDHPSFTHGAYSDAEIAPRARALAQSVLEDAAMPDHLRSPAFQYAVQAWSRMEIASQLLLEYISGQGIGAMVTPRMGGTKTPMEQWKSFEMAAARMRSDLGISPASYARLAKDLGIAQKASEDGLERLAGHGAEIVGRRREIGPGNAPA